MWFLQKDSSGNYLFPGLLIADCGVRQNNLASIVIPINATLLLTEDMLEYILLEVKDKVEAIYGQVLPHMILLAFPQYNDEPQFTQKLKNHLEGSHFKQTPIEIVDFLDIRHRVLVDLISRQFGQPIEQLLVLSIDSQPDIGSTTRYKQTHLN